MRNDAIMKETAISNWTAFDATTDEEAHAIALADPDSPPITDEGIASGKLKRVPQVKVIRRTLGLSQEEFAKRYRIPLGTLRDWEQGRTEPDAPGRAFLRVIALKPEIVREALA